MINLTVGQQQVQDIYFLKIPAGCKYRQAAALLCLAAHLCLLLWEGWAENAKSTPSIVVTQKIMLSELFQFAQEYPSSTDS